MTPHLESFLATSKKLREDATPGPWHFDCGNGTVESWDKKHYRIVVANRDGLSDRIIHCKNFNLGYHPPEFPVHPDLDMEYIAHLGSTSETRDEIIRIMYEALDWLQKHTFEKLNNPNPMPVSLSEICIVRQSLQNVEALAKRAK